MSFHCGVTSHFSFQSEFDIPFTVKAGQIGEFCFLSHRLLPQCHLVAACCLALFSHICDFYLLVCLFPRQADAEDPLEELVQRGGGGHAGWALPAAGTWSQ